MTYFIMGFMFWLFTAAISGLLGVIEVKQDSRPMYAFLIASVIYLLVYLFIIV